MLWFRSRYLGNVVVPIELLASCGIDGLLLTGLFIRNVLLSGSTFERQAVPNTTSALVLSCFALLITATMQFSLAWYLWASLPFRARDEQGNMDFSSSVWLAQQTDPAYSICRTNSFVQMICIALFLFYILNAIPSILKNCLIVLWSCKFKSQDINGVTRIHYWRSCSFWAGMFQKTPFPLEKIDSDVLDSCLRNDWGQDPLRNKISFCNSKSKEFDRMVGYFLPLSCKSSPFKWTMDLPNLFYAAIKQKRSQDNDSDAPLNEPPKEKDWVTSESKTYCDESSMRLNHEIEETRLFFRRKLAEINSETFRVADDDRDLQDVINSRAGEQQSESSAEKHKAATALSETLKDLNIDLDTLKESLKEPQDTAGAIRRTEDASEYLVCLDYCDGINTMELRRVISGYSAVFRSLIALFVGVLPELAVTIMLLVCGVEYILWSGSKVGSDTSGVEEIILGSLAIVFINEIDDAIYEHALPELYKTAHDRDCFNLENWVPSEEPSSMEHSLQHLDEEDQPDSGIKRKWHERFLMWWPFGLFQLRPLPETQVGSVSAPGAASPSNLKESVPPAKLDRFHELFRFVSEGTAVLLEDVKAATMLSVDHYGPYAYVFIDKEYYGMTKWDNDVEKRLADLMQEAGFRSLHDDNAEGNSAWKSAFRRSMRVSEWHADHMSDSRQEDWLFAWQYPFLFARKYRYYFNWHWFECFVWAYGRFGVHLILLVLWSIAIVGGIRASQGCDAGGWVFAFVKWPETCDSYLQATKGLC